MITKTLGTLLILIVCIIVLPIGIAVIGSIFGILAGVLGAVFGGIVGVIGAIFGAIFGTINWLFGDFFDWHPHFNFFSCNIYILGLIAIIVALAVRGSSNRK